MSDSEVENEPSIEEILSSIRQIINEDDEAPEAAANDVSKNDKKDETANPDAPVAQEQKEEEPLDLGAFATDDNEPKEDEKAEEKAEMKPAEPESEDAQMTEDEKVSQDDLDAMFDETPAEEEKAEEKAEDKPADDFAFEEPAKEEIKKDINEEVKAETPAPAAKASDVVEEQIMSDETLGAAAASLTKLAEASVKIDHSHASGGGSITLEDVVKEMLKPMMKSWLDENLPPLVERLVEKEIRKIKDRS